jgi:hypothetical protein
MTSQHLVANRFTGWQDLGSLTFTPDDTDRVVGSFSLDVGQDTLWIRVESETPPTPWPWSYGILGWKTSRGYELGSCKAYSDEAGVVYKLGFGLPPVERSGVITFEPRGFNIAWVKKGNPWTLSFSAQSGTSSSGNNNTEGLGAVVNSFVTTSGDGLSLVRVNF